MVENAKEILYRTNHAQISPVQNPVYGGIGKNGVFAQNLVVVGTSLEREKRMQKRNMVDLVADMVAKMLIAIHKDVQNLANGQNGWNGVLVLKHVVVES